MYYPGDVYPIILSLGGQAVTTPPQIAIADVMTGNLLDLAGAGIKTAAMGMLAGSDNLYFFLWQTAGVPDGNYMALVSYVAGGTPVNGRFLERLRLGDSRITAPVATAALTAKTGDLPPASQVMLKNDFVAPQNDPSVQTILARIDSLPASPADQATLLTIQGMLADVRDQALGTWALDKTVTPNVLTFYRLDGTILAQYSEISTANAQSRVKR